MATWASGSELQTKLRSVPALASAVVHAASLSLDSAGSTYTYRLALANGASGAGARLVEVVMTHAKGSGPVVSNGVMRVAGFTLSNDAAMGCEATKDGATNLYQLAHLSTVKYSRDGATLAYGSRNGNYCGHPSATTVADYGAQIASLTSGAELDPSVKVSGNLRCTSTGWRGNFWAQPAARLSFQRGTSSCVGSIRHLLRRLVSDCRNAWRSTLSTRQIFTAPLGQTRHSAGFGTAQPPRFCTVRVCTLR